MMLDDLVKNSGGCNATMKFFPEYHFEHIYDDLFSADALEGLHQATKDIPGAQQWIVDDGKAFSTNPILSEISKHPLVSSFGHSGGSIQWTITTLKKIYTMGWESFVIKRILFKDTD
jgi:hypothetical protein